MYLASKPDGTILWANDAFCEWSGYSVSELTQMTWMEISVNDGDLKAEIEALKLLNEYQLSYSIEKRYIPKHGKAQVGRLTVTRFPAFGEIQFCWCRWEPFINGTAAAFELAISCNEKLTSQMNDLTAVVAKATSQTEEEAFGLSVMRMARKYPKIAASCLVILLILSGFDNLLGAMQRLGFVASPPITVQSVESLK